MKQITFNDNNLTISDIDDNIYKARAIIINSKGEILLSYYADNYLLPGGKIEAGEEAITGLLREVKEETGIDLDTKKIHPFLQIVQYIKNYPKRENDSVFSNRLNTTDYYLIYSEEDVKRKELNLMPNEKEGGFDTVRVSLEKALGLLKETPSSNPRNKYFRRELETVIQELQELD